MRFMEYFTNYFETWDTHHIKGLETHYYKCFKNVVIDQIKRLETAFGGKIVDENQFGEILFETKNYSVVFTVIFLNGQTSVDIKITGNYFIGLGRPVKDIIKIYEFLDKDLPCVKEAR